MGQITENMFSKKQKILIFWVLFSLFSTCSLTIESIFIDIFPLNLIPFVAFVAGAFELEDNLEFRRNKK